MFEAVEAPESGCDVRVPAHVIFTQGEDRGDLTAMARGAMFRRSWEQARKP